MTTPDDTDLLLLDGDWGSLGVTRLGATVSSWRPRGVERLFTAGDATPALGRMWQGGIPVCAPWFGQAVGQGWAVPWSHGLVSRVRWDVVGVSDAAHEARVSLTADAVIDAVFHPYLAADARGEAAEGLEGVAFHDYATGADGVDRSPVPLAGPIDRVYAGARPVVLPGAELRMDARGADTVVVWNPGPGTSKVPADEWADFACVEYGALARPIPAGGELAIALTLTVR
jgi:glucose-6-phosphate 1-epimerase